MYCQTSTIFHDSKFLEFAFRNFDFALQGYVNIADVSVKILTISATSNSSLSVGPIKIVCCLITFHFQLFKLPRNVLNKATISEKNVIRCEHRTV